MILQRLARRIAAKIERARTGEDAASPDGVIEQQPETDQPSGAQALLERQHETARPNDMRSVAPQNLALKQRLAHQPEFVMLQIAQPTVNELGGSRRRTAGEIVHLRKHDGIAASGGVAGNATPIDAAPDDQQIHYFFGHICSATASSNERHFPDVRSFAASGSCLSHYNNKTEFYTQLCHAWLRGYDRVSDCYR